MANKSPAGAKKTSLKSDDSIAKGISSQPSNPSTEKTSLPAAASDKDRTEHSTVPKVTEPTNSEVAQPLAPPPRPTAQNGETGDYFSVSHNNSHFSLEPNPFEQSFGVSSSEGQGKSLLPPVASLTSPAPLAPGNSSAGGFNWSNSLRSGPLSPAMLTGPTASTDYFDGHLRGGFPTPNESSLRTGLTPGGGGSMFPAPSPNSQALFQQLAGAVPTPSALDFQRSTMDTAAVQKPKTTQEQAAESVVAPSVRQTAAPTEPTSAIHTEGQAQNDPFGHHDAADAANGLYLLAQARNGAQGQSQYVPAPQQNAAAGIAQHSNTSPTTTKRNGRNMSGSLGSLSGSARGMSLDSQEMSEGQAAESTKPNTRNRGKKSSSGTKAANASTNGRRKAEGTPQKTPATKKAKVDVHAYDMGMSDDEGSVKMEDDMEHADGRKMTDEEKRKNFLERNRVAALKCRQRKKQWLANLQAKVEIFSGENDALSAQVTQLREEIVSLKTLLLAHKDCSVSQAQGLGGLAMNNIAGDYGHHSNPYGMAMATGAPVLSGQGIQRR